MSNTPQHISGSDGHPLSADEITTFNCQSDKKISSRYTQLRKQLRSCEHFKENYFVLEVNKPTKSSQDSNTEKKKRKKKQTAATTTDDHSHPDESLSNDDGSEEMKKKKRKKSPSTANTSAQPSTTIEDKVAIHTSPTNSATTISSNNSSTTIQITTSTTCVNNEKQSNATSTPVNQQTVSPLNDNLVLQLMGLLQNNNTSNQNCNNNNQMTLESLELQIKLLQRLQETINLLKGSNQQTPTILPTQESIPAICSNNSMPSIPSSEDIFQQILDYGDCPDNNQSFPVEMTGFASCEDFAELLNGFI